MHWGMVEWLYVLCIDTTCLVAEQPDVYVVDFYSAPHLVTELTERDSEWKKKALLFNRGTTLLQPPGKRRQGSSRWHQRTRCSATEHAHLRDDKTPHRMATGLWLSRCSRMAKAAAPSSRSRSNAWWGAGLPLPRCYDNAEGRPPGAEERLCATCRGRGDGRCLSHDVAPKSVTEVGGYTPRAASEQAASQHRIWRRSSCAEARKPSVTSRGLQLARAACHLRAQEFAAGVRAIPCQHWMQRHQEIRPSCF